MGLEKGTILYDIYASEVVPLEFVDVYLNANYAMFINRSTDKPISVYIDRINELFISELDARNALEDRLFSELQLNREKIRELKNKKDNVIG